MRLATLCTNLPLHVTIRLTPAVDSVQIWTSYSYYAIVESVWSEVVFVRCVTKMDRQKFEQRWSLWWISADGTFSPTRNLITMRCSALRGTFCSLITLATPRQDWTGSNPSRWEGRGCGSTLSRSHSCCAVRLVYTQKSVPVIFEPPCI
jgi:hypothetical protein